MSQKWEMRAFSICRNVVKRPSYCYYFDTSEVARGYQITSILWRPSLVVIDVGAWRKGIFLTFDMANHLPSLLYFGYGWKPIFFVKISTENGKIINGGSRERVFGGAIFKEIPQFLKSNRISLAVGLTSNTDQTCMNKSCFVFLLHGWICRFCTIFGLIGAWPCSAPRIRLWRSWLSVPPNTYMCIPTI